MNFFGHVVAASWMSREAGFGLGSMLPDFASMIGARLVAASDPVTERGVDWHHVTDAAFHRHPVFRRHAAQLTDRLAARGIARGGSLAAGHVGVELLLDGVLVAADHPPADALYLDALTALEQISPSIELSSRRDDISGTPRERLRELGRFLGERGLPVGYRDAETVADRVLRVLANRPRLAIPASQRDVLSETFVEIQGQLASDSRVLISELRQTLTASSGVAGAGESPREPSGS